MKRENDTFLVTLVASVLIIFGFLFYVASYQIYSTSDEGYPDIDEQQLHKAEETSRLLNIIGTFGIVIGSLIIVMTGFNVIYTKILELEEKMNYILDKVEDNK